MMNTRANQTNPRFGLFSACILTCLMIGRGPKKVDQAQIQAEYDYKTALNNYKIGINHMNNNEPIAAIERLEQAVGQDDGNWRYRHALGMAYSLNGQLEEAVEQLSEAVSINENASESYNLLGSIYADMGRFTESRAALAKVIKDRRFPQPAFPYYNLVKCMKLEGRTEEAIAAYKRAIALKPDFYRAYIALAETYKSQGDYENALFHFLKAEDGYTDKVELLYEIGEAYYRLKRYDQAKSYLVQVSIMFPPPNIDKPTQNMLRYIERYQRNARN